MTDIAGLIERLEADEIVRLLKERNREISYVSDQALAPCRPKCQPEGVVDEVFSGL